MAEYEGGGIRVPPITGWRPEEGGVELHILCDDLGIDLWSLARAIAANIRHGWRAQGASTLTQQLARNLILESHEQTLTRKVKEAMLTLRIERTYTKDEIFRMYLNEIYFGEGAHGIEAAARTYFGKSVSNLDLLESVILLRCLCPQSSQAGVPVHEIHV